MNNTALTNSIQNKENQSLETMIRSSAAELGKALPAHMNPERLCRIALTCIRTNPKLAECTPTSFLGALFTSAQMGIEPIGGLAALVPYNNSRKIGGEWKTFKEVQFIMMYQGLISLFYRHESAVSIECEAVKEKDQFDYCQGTGDNGYVKFKKNLSERGKSIAYYAQAVLKNGGKAIMVMGYDECLKHGKEHSKCYDTKNNKFYDNTPWVDDFDAMAKKTVIKQLMKMLPLSFELVRAVAQDETSREYNNSIKDAFDMPSTTEWKEEKPAADKSKTLTELKELKKLLDKQIQAENDEMKLCDLQEEVLELEKKISEMELRGAK